MPTYLFTLTCYCRRDKEEKRNVIKASGMSQKNKPKRCRQLNIQCDSKYTNPSARKHARPLQKNSTKHPSIHTRTTTTSSSRTPSTKSIWQLFLFSLPFPQLSNIYHSFFLFFLFFFFTTAIAQYDV